MLKLFDVHPNPTQRRGLPYHWQSQASDERKATTKQSHQTYSYDMHCFVNTLLTTASRFYFRFQPDRCQTCIVCGKSLLSSASNSLMSPTAQSNTLINFLQHYACQSNKLKLSSVTKGNPSQAVINLVLCLNCNVIRAWQTKTCKIQSTNMATSQQYYDICRHREVIWGIGIKGPHAANRSLPL